ncbi:hypothetical protein [Streptomyces erythrochromogenes]|uniref:hypothetical protein n=1 Tax=Streptomyces erythrochromogenes TaxID=285574 RepID=UPI0036AD9AD1
MTDTDSDDEDLILARALGALGAAGGGSGGRRGAAFAARRLRKNVHEVDLAVGLSQADAAARAADVLLRLGTPVRAAGAVPPAGARVVRALVGGGFGNMNPVLVTVTLTGTGPETTAVRVRGAAKEGLIKQRAGEKTARQVAELLSRADG